MALGLYLQNINESGSIPDAAFGGNMFLKRIEVKKTFTDESRAMGFIEGIEFSATKEVEVKSIKYDAMIQQWIVSLQKLESVKK